MGTILNHILGYLVIFYDQDFKPAVKGLPFSYLYDFSPFDIFDYWSLVREFGYYWLVEVGFIDNLIRYFNDLIFWFFIVWLVLMGIRKLKKNKMQNV